MGADYKKTLNLPRTDFPMKANLQQREPEILKKWGEKDIYNMIMRMRSGSGKTFLLHDGPPYANGHIHVGHVLNKTLKDICVKYFSMKGHLSPYVPGWDCHGLPVEHQLLKEMNITKHEIDRVAFRKKAYNYAMKFVRIQAEEFKRLGIFGDWDNPYLTLSKDYEADILYVLADLYEKGYVYKDLKPVNWCSSCETALAEAEVEYEDKVSPSIYVKFASDRGVNDKETFFVIWTTTPWTLLANVAIALHPDLMYSFVDVGGEIWVMASDLKDTVLEKAGITGSSVLDQKKGKDIAGETDTVRHCFIDRPSAVVLADYVTVEEGTGCVHIAPGHGQDDYNTGKEYSLPVVMPVDDTGTFKAEAGEFAGQNVHKANDAIIEKMRKQGTLVKTEEVSHSYPHCWRCKEPIIFRATEQWFISIDHNDLRKKLLQTIEKDVEWVPESGSDRISSMVMNRPDWCISRQRYWGVSIPVFKCNECDEVFTNTDIIKKVASLTREEGSNVWFEKGVKDLLPEGSSCLSCGGTDFRKENDILDVWFDSGVSYKAVLEARKDLYCPADLYLEGSDQHRGWFQSALITSMGTEGRPPYRKVLTHGFVVDGEGRKMSKSVGNVISPQDVMKKYGADILRLWVASSDYEGDIKLSSEILERLADGYRKIRNTFRFLLSNLYDFDPQKDLAGDEELAEIDRWMLSQLYRLTRDVTGHYDSWEFYKAYRAVYDFCVYEVSSFYLDVLKDNLYIVLPDSAGRRANQTVIFRMLNVLCRVMAPILSFTAEEVWGYINLEGKEDSVHMSDWPDMEKDMAGWEDVELDGKWSKILDLRDRVMKLLEVKRNAGMIGSSLEAAVKLCPLNDTMKKFVTGNIELFPGLFKVSQAIIVEEVRDDMEDVPDLSIRIVVERSSGEKCQRCWNFSDTVGTQKDYSDLCERCYNVISERRNNGEEESK